MASFFQPGLDNPALKECDDLKFEVYCNKVIPTSQRFGRWFQWLNLGIGIAAAVLPLMIILFFRIIRSDKWKKIRLPRRSKKDANSAGPYMTHPTPMHAFNMTKSFTFLSESDAVSVHRSTRSYDLVVMPLTMNGSGGSQLGDSRSSISTNSGVVGKMSLASVEIDALGSNALDDSQIEETADFLADSYSRNGLAGFALQVSTAPKPEQLDGLVERLYRSRIPVLVSCNHDSEALDAISLTHVSGLIIENACILPDGERRSYFSSQRFRDIITRCHKERAERPQFFIGFLDRWDKRPHPATIRRAVKLAEHFGAVFEHGPADPLANLGKPTASATDTISGFEFIRRAEVIQLQKSWMSQAKETWVGNEPLLAPETSSLSLTKLDEVIPRASQLMRHHELDTTPSLRMIRDEDYEMYTSVDYIDLAPACNDFWKSSSDGKSLSSKGCYPLTSQPLSDHYDAVVDTQEHLRDLGMLHFVEGPEELNLVKALTALTLRGKCDVLVHELVKALADRQVRVYKGMDTGFGVQDTDGHFWGVAKTHGGTDENRIDIFVSQKAPCDVSTVLHTWLAHRRMPREQRYEQELELEAANNQIDESGIPLDIRASIERATYSECLSLLQKLRVSREKHKMGQAIKNYCSALLVRDTTKTAWALTCAKAAIDDNIDMRDILRMRLEHFVRQGATKLPSLDDLVALYDLTFQMVEENLFLGRRDKLNHLTKVLCDSYDLEQPTEYVDVNTELYALIFFTVLRRFAFEEVYNESTDRCPMFSSQPDQAAVFSELWILGSQCEIYFGLPPRDLGSVIYRRYQEFLKTRPPIAADRRNNEMMSMYFTPDTSAALEGDGESSPESGPSKKKRTPYEISQEYKKRFAQAGAMSIFCVPAIIDVLLLTFVGRGFFMTAFMDFQVLETTGYALLISLLITAGVTGWVGSIANYYLAHYAYDNMVYFHVQRLSGGFIITFIISIVGLIMFSVRFSVGIGFVFVAYLMCITTHFNLLGIMSSMHQHESPLVSGRTILLQNMPVLFLSPIISSFVNGHDLAIYLPIMYFYLFLTLYRYRRLCHQWSGWMDNIPKFTKDDIFEWYIARLDIHNRDQELKDQHALALETFVATLDSYQRHTKGARAVGVFQDPFVARIANGLPYIDWLFKKTNPTGNLPDLFSGGWFTQLNESKNQQSGLIRGLKDHNVFTLFRLARYDIGQNLVLFLVALMDRWVMIVCSAAGPFPSIYTNSHARYGICLCIVYFCVSAMLLDLTLHKYWGVKDKISKEKLKDFEHAQKVAEEFEIFRRANIVKALKEVMSKLILVFGITTLLLWVFVKSWETTALYYMYILGYTSTIIFQFNRCFTTNVTKHISIIFVSAGVGFITGCVLRGIPATSQFLFNEVIAQNVAAVLAAVGTSLWTIRDWTARAPSQSKVDTFDGANNTFVQRRLTAEESMHSKIPSSALRKNLSGTKIWGDDGKNTSSQITRLLRLSLQEPNLVAFGAPWAEKLVRDAANMWANRKITVKIVSREEFHRAGLHDVCSFSSYETSVLQLTVGFMGESELANPAWQPLLASITSEAIFFHVARSHFGLSHNRALHAEHFLHNSGALSNRLRLELSTAGPQHVSRLALKTEMELMGHLCLDLDVDSTWEELPQAVREAIVHRIHGKPISLTHEFTSWASKADVSMQTEDFNVAMTLEIFQKCQEILSYVVVFPGKEEEALPPRPAELRPVHISRTRMTLALYQIIWGQLSTVPVIFVKWVAILSGGASNVERELAYCLRNIPMRGILVRIILGFWYICRVVKNFWIYWILIYHRPALFSITRLAQKGARRKISKNTVIVELPRKTITGFASVNDNNTMSLKVYNGLLKEEPTKGKPMFVDTYDEAMRLKSREDSDGGACTYQYDSDSRWPATKVMASEGSRSVGYYDKYGRVVHGTRAIGDCEFVVQYHYKSAPKGNSDLLQADYKLVGSATGDMLSIYWGKPTNIEEHNWAPSKDIGLIIKKINDKTYTSEYNYTHRRDPVITTHVQESDGTKTDIAGAPEVFPHESDLSALPTGMSFDADDLLIYHSTLRLRQMRRYAGSAPKLVSSLNPISWITFGNKREYATVPTWRIRTELWNRWLKSGTVDAVTACWIDELILREETLLRPYWRARDTGRLEDARSALDANIDQIVAAIDIDTDVSEVTLLTIKTADLYAMGLSNDATQVTRRPQDCFNDTENRISVIFNDIGCWPVAPGGVSNCRRDLVNGHKTIRNHVLAECANDYGIPRFQIQKSVQSLKLLPLWGIDGGTANHGVINNLLESQVDEKVSDIDTQRDIVGVFVPLLMDFVKGARTKRLTREDLVKYSNVILSMAKYYEYKDYTFTWQSKEVEDAWVASWLVDYKDPNINNPRDCFEIERPTIPDFRDALGIFRAYFFIFAVNVPEECPQVFQSTHHGISSLFGLVLKYRRGANFGIWDHAILWRECCLNISAAQSELPLSVQSMLLASIGLATRLAYFHADVITPCASLFNPMWEAEIGTDKGTVGNRNQFRRKIDPIVNGISNMESFTPVDNIRTETPTVVMLSNIQIIKGVKIAIQAANIIINQFKFTDYKLVIYGAKDRSPAYTQEMEKFINDNNLTGKVVLAGFGSPKEVLKDAWLFMNSSISEGLPLAIGEAALAGVPIVATEVGATALVLTDQYDPEKRYGEVVPPNDPLALARAQISVLGMVGPWTKYTDEAGQKTNIPTLPDVIAPSDVEWLTKRFYEKAEYRRQLGMLSRQVVLHSFHGNRYLREHEQMFWVQWHQGKMKRDKKIKAHENRRFKYGTSPPLRYIEEEEELLLQKELEEEKQQPSVAVLEQWSPDFREEAKLTRSRLLNRQRPNTFMSTV